jgi:uncharacterized protein (TIGR03067 family)
MRNFIILSLTVLTQITGAFSQTNPVVKQKENLDRLKGSWTLSAWTDRDKNRVSDQATIIFGDNNRATLINGKDTLKGTFIYNAQKNPNWMDFEWKNSMGASQSQGVIKWIDDATARVIVEPKGKVHPTTFQDDPDLDRSDVMRKQMIVVSYLKDYLTMGKWDVIYLFEESKYVMGKKYQTITFQVDNTYQIQGTPFIPGSSGKGRYELNTNLLPHWIDLYPDKGGKIMGLIQEHLAGYRIEIFKQASGGHPVQFSDVEFGDANVINFNTNFLYLQPSTYYSPKVEPNPLPQTKLVPELSGKYIGTWTGSDYIYEGELFIATTSDMKVTGKILWTLLRSPNMNDTRIGKSGVEYISGGYDPNNTVYVFDGIRKDDPNNVIGLDSYRLGRSLYDDRLVGRTKGHDNSWVALFVLVKYGDIGKIDMPFDSIYYNQKKHTLNKSTNLKFKFAFDDKIYRPATGIISFIKFDNQWTGNIWYDQLQLKETLQDVSFSGGRISFSVPYDPAKRYDVSYKQHFKGAYLGLILPDGKVVGILSTYPGDNEYLSWTAEIDNK